LAKIGVEIGGYAGYGVNSPCAFLHPLDRLDAKQIQSALERAGREVA
jgi:hypothetical protein